MEEVQIHYFSGTGNSKNVALVFAQEAKTIGIPTEIIDVAQTNRLHISQPKSNALLVFVSPVHGFNYPPVILHYLFRFPRGRNQVVLMNTRAGMRIGRWITPGISGISLYLSALILILKGYHIQALYPVDLPSNWISLHPGLTRRTVNFIYSKILPQIRTFAQQTLAGNKNFWSVRECLIDTVLAPIAVLYYVVGRFIIAKTFYASHDCTQCGLCQRQCPIQAIKIIDKRPFWTFHCESCMRCMNNCPKRAIETAHGTLLVFALTFSCLFSFVTYKYSYFSPINQNGGLKFILENVLFLFLFLVFYRMLHYLLRYKWFERAVVYTSLTKFNFWRRYKSWKIQ